MSVKKQPIKIPDHFRHSALDTPKLGEEVTAFLDDGSVYQVPCWGASDVLPSNATGWYYWQDVHDFLRKQP